MRVSKTRLWTIVVGCLVMAAFAGFSPYLLHSWSRWEQPQPLFEDIGDYSRKITTTSALAQRYFDQGLVLLYAFNEDEARRSFHAAADADPSCAMAHWGIAMADRENAYAAFGRTNQGDEGWSAAHKARSWRATHLLSSKPSFARSSLNIAN